MQRRSGMSRGAGNRSSPPATISSRSRFQSFGIGNGRVPPGGGMELSVTGGAPVRLMRVDER